MKAEARSHDSSFRNKFYDNRLTLRYRWEDTGAGFNIIFRTKGRETEMYGNTITAFDFTPIDSAALNIEGLSTDIYDNKFYLKGTPSGLSWFAQLKNGIDVPTTGQRLLFESNKFYNETLVQITAMLQITTTDDANTFSNIDVNENKCFGLWSSLVRPEFGTVTDIVDIINIVHNTFPNTAIFRPGSAFTFNTINVLDNIVTAQDAESVVGLGFITLTDKVSIKTNIVKSEQGGTGTLNIAASTNTIGTLANADIELCGNTIAPFSGSLLYLFGGGGDLAVDNVTIQGNDVRWLGSSAFTNFVLAKGANVFAMNANTLINQLDAATGLIGRPTDGANSKYLNNLTIGSITDNPTP